MNANYRIASIPVRMSPLYSPLVERSVPYHLPVAEQSETKAAMDLTISEEVFEHYRRLYPDANDALIEYMVTGTFFYTGLLRHNGILLHASAVEMDGEAYLFSAASGVGKSTHTALWLSVFGERASILNDDKPALRFTKDGVFAYGTPWSGKSDLNRNRKVPLKGIAFIERGDRDEITPMGASQAIEPLLAQTVRPKDRALGTLLLDRISEIIARVPIWRLACTMSPDAARLAYSAMKQGVVK